MRPTRSLVLLALLLLAAGAPAQIIGVRLQKTALKRFKDQVLMHNGHPILCGQIVQGLEIAENGSVAVPPNTKSVVLAVADPAKPEREIFKVDRKGRIKEPNKRHLARLSMNEIHIQNGLHVLFPGQSLVGLRSEYLRKKGKLDALEKERNGQKRASKEWFELHRDLLVQTDSLIAWLQSTVWKKAAVKLEKEYKRELKKADLKARIFRLEAAKSAVKPCPVPKELQASLKSWDAAHWGIHAVQGKHVRLFADEGIERGSLKQLAILCERVIEGLRNDLIDPFIDEENPDPVPDGVFVEYFFVPDDKALMARIYEEYYLQSFGPQRDRALEIEGHFCRNGRGTDYVYFYRRTASCDPESIVANTLGKFISNMAFNDNLERRPPQWLEQGFGYWAAFEFVGRNSLTTVDFAKQDYARSADKEGNKSIGQNLRANFNRMALDDGPALEKLFITTRVEMSDADYAKSWSFLDFLLAKHRERCPKFFREACANKGYSRTMDANGFRPVVGEVFGFAEGERDPYAQLNDAWKAFATSEQKTDASRRR